MKEYIFENPQHAFTNVKVGTRGIDLLNTQQIRPVKKGAHMLQGYAKMALAPAKKKNDV